MISSLRGTLKRTLADRIVLDVQGVGYEVFLPAFVFRTIGERSEGETMEMEIYYHVTDRQLRPTLIGFNNGFEKRFFEKFITVEDIGPQKAARALVFSVSTIARAIEAEDIGTLRQMPGIGERTARKMVATLRGKVAEEALLRDEGFENLPPSEQESAEPSLLRAEGIEVLVSLGHRQHEASSKVDAALARDPELASIEDLIREVYRGERVGRPA
ncbi:MAG: Holliday junction branch migration protein RuvA [Chloroflexota bacterium]